MDEPKAPYNGKAMKICDRLKPGESMMVPLEFTEQQLLDMLYHIQRGDDVGITVEYEDDVGRTYSTTALFTEEMIMGMLERRGQNLSIPIYPGGKKES